MADHPSQSEPIEWYLARDGQQHGPLSEVEMRAFVDMGHLRPTDLIWRPGFPDWLSAADVFAVPAPAAARPSMPQPAPQTAAPSPAATVPTATMPAAAMSAAAIPAAVSPEPVRQQLHPVQQPQPHQPAPQPQMPLQPQQPVAREPAPAELVSPDQLFAPQAAPAPANAQSRAAAAQAQMPSHAVRPAMAGPARPAGPSATDPTNPFGWPTEPRPMPAAGPAPHGPRPAAGAAGLPTRPAQQAPFEHDFEDGDEDLEPRRSLGLGRIAAGLLLAILVGAGVAAALRPDKLAGVLPPGVLQKTGLEAAPARAAPFVAAGASSEAIDQSLQRTAIWRHIKTEFPEWYAERLKEAEKFASEKRGEGAIAKHFAEAMVALRRKHANQALTASPERLRFVATTFLDNLQNLARQNVDTCYGFISQGETFPAVLELLQKPAANQGLEKQMVAVFEAIAEGRRAPQSYMPPRKSDYDVLAGELNARGWSENDLRTFSDPRALGRASPQDVCRMVQDWFAAQIAIKDNDTQLRLLVESLRPVVAG